MSMDCIKAIRKRHLSVVIYTFSLALNIPFGALSAVCLYQVLAGCNKNQLSLFILIWFSEVFFAAICIVFRAILNRNGAERKQVAPYIISTGIKSYDQLIDKLSLNLGLVENTCGGYYSFERRKRGYLCIINYMNEYQGGLFDSILKKSTYFSRKACGLKNRGSLLEIRGNIRIYINVFDRLNGSIETIIQSNALYGTAKAESSVSLFWELKTGSLYIPAYSSKWYGGSIVYNDTINYLRKKEII